MRIDVTAAGAHEPILHCPNCNHEIKLTESLAAPLLDKSRRQFQEQLAQKDAEVARQTDALRNRNWLWRASRLKSELGIVWKRSAPNFD
jgi:hypothetical protein